MIHISNFGNNKWQVTTVGKNGEVLNSTKGLSSKAACIKNIKATMLKWGSPFIVFQDDSFKKPRVFHLQLVQKENSRANGLYGIAWVKTYYEDAVISPIYKKKR